MKVLFITYNLTLIDNWISRLFPYIKGCNCSLIHIGKLQKKNVTIINGIDYYDISSFSYKKIETLLNNIGPDLVIVFSFRSLFELFFQRICVKKGIRQVYLEHGIFSQTTTHFKTNKLKTEFFQTIRRQLKFLSIFIEYAIHVDNTLKELLLLYKVYYQGKFNYSQFDQYYLYGKRSYDSLSKIYHLTQENTIYMGYPIFNNDKEKKEYNTLTKISDEVLYVHQPFILDGFSNINYDEEKDFINKLNQVIRKKYTKLIVLLHPRENLLTYKKRFSDTEVEFIQSPNNYKCFTDKSLVLGHFSTALLYSLYFCKPTIIIDFPGMKFESPYKQCFKFCSHIESLLDNNYGIDNSLKDYYLGPVNTYEHIADLIFKTDYKHNTDII